MGTFVELGHILEDGMAAYPGLPAPRIDAVLSHEESRDRYQGKAEFYLGRVDMPCNVGTYMDAPFHRFPDGDDLSRIALESVAGLPGLVVDVPTHPRATSLDMDERPVWGHAVLVGVDFWNVDDPDDWARPAHTRLLHGGILIVEHLCNLGALPAGGFRFSAVPLRIVRGASFPVRAYAELDAQGHGPKSTRRP